jgi:DNA-binding NarL/FixJ family response regulator
MTSVDRAAAEAPMSIRVVLVDDHPVVLEGIAQILRQHPGIEVVAACSNGADAVAAVRAHRPDVLVLDLRMGEMGGLEVLAALHEEQSPVRVLLLTATIDEDETMEAVRLGVRGIVLKETPPLQLLDAIRDVHQGRKRLDPTLLTRTLERSVRLSTGAREAAAMLTARELEIVGLVAHGLRNREVADRLHITEGTVKLHLHNIYDKLQVDGRIALLLYAQDKGLA